MAKTVMLQLPADLVQPLVETLQSRARVWQETVRLLRTRSPTANSTVPLPELAEAEKMAGQYTGLVQQIVSQLGEG